MSMHQEKRDKLGVHVMSVYLDHRQFDYNYYADNLHLTIVLSIKVRCHVDRAGQALATKPYALNTWE